MADPCQMMQTPLGVALQVECSSASTKSVGLIPESFSEGFFVKLRRPYNTA